MYKLLLVLFIQSIGLTILTAQYHNPENVLYNQPTGVEGETKMTWCTTSPREQYKCTNLSMAVERDKVQFGKEYLDLGCKQAFDTEECMNWVDNGETSVLALDAGEVFIGGRYHSLVPILQEQYDGGFSYEYSVAVIKKGGIPSITPGSGLYGMRGAKACFPLVGTLAGWVLPIYTLMQEGGLKITDCNNHVKSAIEYFGDSCAINSLIDMYNPIGDNSDKLCKLCAGGAGVRCTSGDPFAGYVGGLKCLLEAGDVAFLRHTTVLRAIHSNKIFAGVSEDTFELVCRDGSRKPIRDWINCHWGRAPADAIVTTSAIEPEKRVKFQNFIMKLVEMYGAPNQLNISGSVSENTRDPLNPYRPGQQFGRDEFGNPYTSTDRYSFGRQDQYGRNDEFGRNRDEFDRNRDEFGRNRDDFGRNRDDFGRNRDDFYNRQSSTTPRLPRVDENGNLIESFKLFESLHYGTTDLMLQDATVSFRVIPEDKQAAIYILENEYVGKSAMKAVNGIRDCPIKRARLCVTSDVELLKCNKMKIALKAAFLSPDLDCHRAHSTRECERSIAGGVSDFTMLDPADMLHAAANFKLVPFMSEVYTTGETWYYAVAVAKEQDPDTDLTYLKGKNTCHTGIGMAAGWVYPLAYLLANGWMRPYGCDGARAASEYFSKSCAPGALSTEYADADHVPRDNLCHLCHGAAYRRCRRDALEDYYGHAGAIRCLVEGGGHVAFVRHTAPMEVAGGRRREWWARDLLYDDMQLLCPDGTRAKITEYKKCNLGKVPGSVLVGRANHTELDVFSNLMVYSEQLYGAITSDEFSFSMFYSQPPYTDLIFSDAAVQLKPIPHHARSAEQVAGPSLPRAARLVSCDAPQALANIEADPYFLAGAAQNCLLTALLAVTLTAIVIYR